MPLDHETIQGVCHLLTSMRTAIRKISAPGIARIDRSLASQIEAAHCQGIERGIWCSPENDAVLQVFCLLDTFQYTAPQMAGADLVLLARLASHLTAVKNVALDLDADEGRAVDRTFSLALAAPSSETSPTFRALTALMSGFAMLAADKIEAVEAAARAEPRPTPRVATASGRADRVALIGSP